MAAGLMIGLGMGVMLGYAGWRGEGMPGQLGGPGFGGLLIGVLYGALFGITAAGGIWLMAWSRSSPRRRIAVSLLYAGNDIDVEALR
jgi:hypothetical protein